MPRLHDFIYGLEEGVGKRWLRLAAAILALLLILLCYNWICFRNMGTQEARDYAQLGRNIAEGKGYTTLFIRPLSIRLLQDRAAANPPLDARGRARTRRGSKGRTLIWRTPRSILSCLRR